ncbi:MAG TPA: cysteine--tRNA ligase [Dehalococcoidia bacterium]|nr:cysteine--tRNA ligase [Dehalococcoidia bacterium]
MKVYNTLTRQKEEFVPQGDEVKMYVCGVTPYDECHLGHAMSYIVFDVIRRYLKFRGYRVRYVQNFTDIDDKIIARSQELGIDYKELVERHIEAYFRDMDALNIQRADVYPYATQEIPKIQEVISTLIDKGYAYPARGSVYFRVSRFPGYGKLSRRSLEEMRASSPDEEGKEHPLDFALWKAAKPNEPTWESPWGPGRPGWHIECSAMSLKYLGDSLDIHGGGQDLIFPHHENEIAQSESFTGVEPFVRYWLHNGMVQLGEEKMSKSTGKLVPLKEALSRYSPDALRLFVLSSHYRSPLRYSEEGVLALERAAGRLREAATAATPSTAQPLSAEAYRRRFIQAMDDDFNTAQAVACLFDLARDINRARDEGANAQELQSALRELCGVLGLTLEAPEIPMEAQPFIELLVSVRQELRQARQWQLADAIRSRLGELGIALEDTPQGTVWKLKR